MLRSTFAVAAGVLLTTVAVTLDGPGPSTADAFPRARPNGVADPCRTPKTAKRLLCPDLRIGRPSEMRLDRRLARGRALLRATNDIRSRGQGPLEVRGHRDRAYSMNVMQAIKRRAGGYALFPTEGRLRYFNVGYQWGGAYWKFRNPLRFELWRVNRAGRRTKMVRTGPKQFYCFRDLKRTNPSPRSPREAVYPACNQNPKVRHTTLGTSVGWSDIYPSTYDKQWIDVTGLRGCFAYVLHLDPSNVLFELNKRNNRAQRIIRLPWRGYARRGC